MTPQERAEQVAHTYYSLGPTNLIDLISAALTATRRAALLEARQAVSKLFDQQASELPDYYAALLDAGNALDRLAQEG